MMKKHNKLALAAISAALAVSCAVGGTLAWLSSITKPVTNTITLGNVCITLDEAKLGGKPGERTDTGNNYTKVEPGVSLCKDPTVHIKKDSEKCYVFLKITNEFMKNQESPAGTPAGYKTIAQQLVANGWQFYKTDVAAKVDYYVYNGAGSANFIFDPATAPSLSLVAFTDFAIKTSITGGPISPIVVTAGAIQSAGMADKDAAFAALGL
ncbi:MAG: hypothetical protein PHO10_03600 [Gemmiger sp.]|nr:hypothetical protein [Gemmiger sp.]